MFFDILFTFLVFGTVTFGFFYGVIRITVVLITYYLSVVLASLYCTSLGLFLEHKYLIHLDLARFLGFILVLVVSFIFLTAAGLYTFRHTRLPNKLQHFERWSGVLSSIVLALLLITLIAIVLWNMTIEQSNNTPDSSLVSWLNTSVGKSFVIRYIGIEVQPTLYTLVDPMVPDAAKIIFSPNT